MKVSPITLIAAASLSVAAVSLVPAMSASAIPVLNHLTVTLTASSGTWQVPFSATNIHVIMQGAAGQTDGDHVSGSGGAAEYVLVDSLAGETLSYAVGSVGAGSPAHPGYTNQSGGGATALAADDSLLVVVGGGGGSAQTHNAATTTDAGGDGGASTGPGAGVGHDGTSIIGGHAAGAGGQAASGGLANGQATASDGDVYRETTVKTDQRASATG